MVQFHSLNTIIDDLLNESRSSDIAESESLSRIQIEQWIIEYRSILIKQDIDKGRKINPDYEQEIRNIHVVSDASINSNVWVGKTSIKIPNGVDFHFENPITEVSDSYGNIIQLLSEKRSRFQNKRRYGSNETVAYKKGEYLYISGNGGVDYIDVKGIFEDPMSSQLGLTADDRYPIPANMVTTLKELIMTKEINIVALADVSNDSSNDLTKSQLSSSDYKKISRGIK
jgi:hypothetical protein